MQRQAQAQPATWMTVYIIKGPELCQGQEKPNASPLKTALFRSDFCLWVMIWVEYVFVFFFFGGGEVGRRCAPFVFKTSQGPEPCNSTFEETQKCQDKLTKNCLAAAHINRQSNVLTAPLMRIMFSERKGEENATVRLCNQTQDKL